MTNIYFMCRIRINILLQLEKMFFEKTFFEDNAKNIRYHFFVFTLLFIY